MRKEEVEPQIIEKHFMIEKDCVDAEIDFKYKKDNNRKIKNSDLLFIDNRYKASALKKELSKHGPNVFKYILINKTEEYKEESDIAINGFLNENKDWVLHRNFNINHDGGMICLIKRRLPSPKFPEDAGLKILGVPTPDACGFYRIIQPCTELCEEYPDMFVSAKFLNLNEQDVGLSSVSDADIIFIQRGAPNNPSKVLQILHLARSLGKMIIYDLDDYWAVPKWNPAYRLWTQTNLEYYIKQVLRDSTVITCTTNKFKEEIEKYTDKPTYIVRNAISRKHKNWSLEKKESILVRSGWVGGIHHIAYKVSDIDQVVNEWKKRDVEFLTDNIIDCPDDKLRQIFTKPLDYLGGIIIELIERGSKGFCEKSVKDLMNSTKGL